MSSASSPRTPATGTILLVDDNHDGVEARRALLEELGYTVVPAHSGDEALKHAIQQKFDLIITDFKMGPMDGLELISALRKKGQDMPVILLTGFADALGLTPDRTGANVVIQKSSNEVSNLLRHTKRLLQPPRKPARSQRQSGTRTQIAK